jgi:hypothetical protein
MFSTACFGVLFLDYIKDIMIPCRNFIQNVICFNQGDQSRRQASALSGLQMEFIAPSLLKLSSF